MEEVAASGSITFKREVVEVVSTMLWLLVEGRDGYIRRGSSLR